MIIAPRNDGVIVSIDGKLHHMTMTPEQMMHMAIRFQQAAIEILKQERREAAYAQSVSPLDSGPDDTNDCLPSG